MTPGPRRGRKPKRRRETQSPAAPEPHAPAPDTGEGSAGAVQGCQPRASKARRRREVGADAAGDAEQARRDAVARAMNDARRSNVMTRRTLQGPVGSDTAAGTSSRSGPRRDVHATHSGNAGGSGAGDGKLQVSSLAVTRNHHAPAHDAAGGAAAASADGTSADPAAAGGNASLHTAAAAPTASQQPAALSGAGSEALGGDAGMSEGRAGELDRVVPGAGSKDTYAATASRSSRGRSRGKGTMASEVTHSEVTKDSVGMGSGDGKRRRVAGVPLPATIAPGLGNVCILTRQQISDADVAGSADPLGGEANEGEAAGEHAMLEDAAWGGIAGDEARDGMPGDGEVGTGGTGEALGRGARQAARREAQEVANAMDQAESHGHDTPVTEQLQPDATGALALTTGRHACVCVCVCVCVCAAAAMMSAALVACSAASEVVPCFPSARDGDVVIESRSRRVSTRRWWVADAGCSAVSLLLCEQERMSTLAEWYCLQCEVGYGLSGVFARPCER